MKPGLILILIIGAVVLVVCGVHLTMANHGEKNEHLLIVNIDNALIKLNCL